jgi:hypothetical protein
MDNLVFEESVNSELSQSEFVDKQWLYVNDNNNSSYSSQIVLDTTPLSNAGGYISWMEAFISMPLVLQVQGDPLVLTDAIAADWMVGMKSGFWQILHSLTCEFNNGNIIQQVPFLNIFCSFKNLTSWSANDVKDWGSVCGFAPDTCRSWIYNNVASAAANFMGSSGTGLSNNRIAPYVSIIAFTQGTCAAAPGPIVATTQAYNTTTIASTTSGNFRQLVNYGLQQRIAWLNYSLKTNNGTLLNTSSNQAGLLGVATACAQTFQSYIASAAGSRAIIFDAIIRLKDVADFFQKVPLLKGSTMRIYLNTNQVYFTCGVVNSTYAAATGVQNASNALTLTSAPIILGGGGTNPVMITSSDLGQGTYNLAPIASDAVAAAATALQVGLSIVRTQFSQFTLPAGGVSAPITSCRLYAPCYTMSPIAESRYLSLTPTKKVIYNDIFQYQFSNLPTNGTFNVLVSNGIPNVRGVLVVPLISASVAANGVAGVGAYIGVATSTLLSPFTTTGGTPDPIQITNFNIQVSGKNLFLNNLQYGYEQFVEQLVSSNQLNGSLTTSLASGLIGKEDFEYNYRYLYGNVSRSLPSEDGVSKAIQILGVNNSPVAIDLMVFVEFEREITIDVRTGARIM